MGRGRRRWLCSFLPLPFAVRALGMRAAVCRARGCCASSCIVPASPLFYFESGRERLPSSPSPTSSNPGIFLKKTDSFLSSGRLHRTPEPPPPPPPPTVGIHYTHTQTHTQQTPPPLPFLLPFVFSFRFVFFCPPHLIFISFCHRLVSTQLLPRPPPPASSVLTTAPLEMFEREQDHLQVQPS